ncbi:MAG: hypothetical protein JSR78_10485, partial [Proteobacteria bacterium]|nr:hypothetical protein [Pseudomonadota bacterium]
MLNVQDLFEGQDVTFVVADDRDLVFCQREFRMPAVKLDDIRHARIRSEDITQNLLILCETEDEGIEQLNDLMAQGCDAADLRFVDLGIGETPSHANIQQLLSRLARRKDVYWKTTRSISNWGESTPLETFDTYVDQLTARWAFPDLAVFCGGYGSGKSTIAQMFALKLAHHRGWPIHICAWEDRRDDLRDRLWRTSIGAAPHDDLKGTDPRPALALEKIVFWDEPEALDERSLIKYFERVRYFHRSHGVKVFVCDPWNEFDHDYSTQERETVYIR